MAHTATESDNPCATATLRFPRLAPARSFFGRRNNVSSGSFVPGALDRADHEDASSSAFRSRHVVPAADAPALQQDAAIQTPPGAAFVKSGIRARSGTKRRVTTIKVLIHFAPAARRRDISGRIRSAWSVGRAHVSGAPYGRTCVGRAGQAADDGGGRVEGRCDERSPPSLRRRPRGPSPGLRDRLKQDRARHSRARQRRAPHRENPASRRSDRNRSRGLRYHRPRLPERRPERKAALDPPAVDGAAPAPAGRCNRPRCPCRRSPPERGLRASRKRLPLIEAVSTCVSCRVSDVLMLSARRPHGHSRGAPAPGGLD